MEYFESNINVIRSQIKANKKYKEISNLFKQRFPEVRRGFSERNLRLFCSKHGISKLNEAEIDAVIQQCVSEVRLPAFHLSFDFEERGKKLKKLEKFLFLAFLRLVRYKYYSRKLLQFISKTNPKNIRLFMRKGGLFLRFS